MSAEHLQPIIAPDRQDISAAERAAHVAALLRSMCVLGRHAEGYVLDSEDPDAVLWPLYEARDALTTALEQAEKWLGALQADPPRT